MCTWGRLPALAGALKSAVSPQVSTAASKPHNSTGLGATVKPACSPCISPCLCTTRTLPAGELPQGGPAVPGGLGGGASRPRAGVPAAHRASRAQLVHGPGQPSALLCLRGLWLPALAQMCPGVGGQRPPAQPALLYPSVGRHLPALLPAAGVPALVTCKGKGPGNADVEAQGLCWTATD